MGIFIVIVAHIGGKQVQFILRIVPLLIPAHKPVHSKAVAKGMDRRAAIDHIPFKPSSLWYPGLL
jgi:hypothetical protein